MFKGLANLAQMMKQAQEAQARMGELQERLGQLRVHGSAGGLVTVEMGGFFHGLFTGLSLSRDFKQLVTAAHAK